MKKITIQNILNNPNKYQFPCTEEFYNFLVEIGIPENKAWGKNEILTSQIDANYEPKGNVKLIDNLDIIMDYKQKEVKYDPDKGWNFERLCKYKQS